jgi:hypothetical protein
VTSPSSCPSGGTYQWDIEAQQRLQDLHVTAAGEDLRGTLPRLAVVTGDSRVIGAMISRGLVLEGTPTPAGKDEAETVRGIVVGSSRVSARPGGAR